VRGWPKGDFRVRKIALLTKYGNLAASTRQRFLQYRPFFESAGYEFDEQPLLDNAYLERLYEGHPRDLKHITYQYIQRLFWLINKCDADVLWLHCELFPYLPGVLERFARFPGKPIVFDFDDAIFHSYDAHPRVYIRRLLGRKLYTTISGSRLILAGNSYLADYSREKCRRVEVVPTVVDTDQYKPGPSSHPRSEAAIGWIGTPSTWKDYMIPILPLLGRVASDTGARIVAVGASDRDQSDVEVFPWTEETEVSRIQAMDIGVMPLTDTPWARGKCGYKLIQYMACGLPVVASPVGANIEIVDQGVNGFLVETHDEWYSALETLIEDPELRLRMGQMGREKVERDYSLKVQGPRVTRLLTDLVA